MDAVTYPQKNVTDFINDNLVPVRVAFDAEPYAGDFNIKWTPTLITLGTDGREHHRTVGFLDAGQLVPSLLLGKGKLDFDHDRFTEALASLEKIIGDYGGSDSAPEAIFLAGVCRFKSTHDPKPLKAAYEKLAAGFPDNEWSKRAYPYRLL